MAGIVNRKSHTVNNNLHAVLASRQKLRSEELPVGYDTLETKKHEQCGDAPPRTHLLKSSR